MPKEYFTEDEMNDMMWEDSEEFHKLADEIVDRGRWSIYHFIVFKSDKDGKLYGVNYEEPATEMQDCQKRWPMINSRGLIEAVEVKAVEVVTTKYKEV